jgi:hypothetical protein
VLETALIGVVSSEFNGTGEFFNRLGRFWPCRQSASRNIASVTRLSKNHQKKHGHTAKALEFLSSQLPQQHLRQHFSVYS